jgi:hypothetical protein
MRMPLDGRHIFGARDSAGCFHGVGPVGCHRYRSVVAGVIESLTAPSSGAMVVLCVDDVHLLDDLSIFVVYQIVQRVRPVRRRPVRATFVAGLVQQSGWRICP